MHVLKTLSTQVETRKTRLSTPLKGECSGAVPGMGEPPRRGWAGGWVAGCPGGWAAGCPSPDPRPSSGTPGTRPHAPLVTELLLWLRFLLLSLPAAERRWAGAGHCSGQRLTQRESASGRDGRTDAGHPPPGDTGQAQPGQPVTTATPEPWLIMQIIPNNAFILPMGYLLLLGIIFVAHAVLALGLCLRAALQRSRPSQPQAGTKPAQGSRCHGARLPPRPAPPAPETGTSEVFRASLGKR